jgi:hypothetical protein
MSGTVDRFLFEFEMLEEVGVELRVRHLVYDSEH